MGEEKHPLGRTPRENPGYAYEKRAPALRWYPPEWLIQPCN